MSHSVSRLEQNRQDEFLGRNYKPIVTATVMCECGDTIAGTGHNRPEALYNAMHKRAACRRGHEELEREMRASAARIEKMLAVGR